MADLPIFDLPDTGARLRAVERALVALREGRCVGIAGTPPATVTAVETSQEEPHPSQVLILTPARATVLGQAVPEGAEAVAFRLPPGTGMALLRALADPTVESSPAGLVAAPLPDTAGASVVLAKLARLLPALLLAPAEPGVALLPPADIRAHPALVASQLVQVSAAAIPMEGIAQARLLVFRSPGAALDHLAVVVGEPTSSPAPLVRIHSECFTGDLLGSLRCDCGPQLRGAVARIAADGTGALLYLAQEGRGVGLANKMRAYTLQDRGFDTADANRALGFNADERDFAIAAAMLRHLGIGRVRLLTNNPEKLASLAAHGIEVAGRESLLFAANGVNDAYLETKARRFGHLLD